MEYKYSWIDVEHNMKNIKNSWLGIWRFKNKYNYGLISKLLIIEILLKTFREDSFCLCVLVFLILSKICVEIISLNFYVFLDNVQFIYSAFDFRTGNTWTISKIQITSGCMYFLFSFDLLHIYTVIRWKYRIKTCRIHYFIFII